MSKTSVQRRFPFPRLPAKLVGRALAGHRVLGLALAGLIYLLALSGVLSVFNHELQRWEQPGAPAVEAVDPEAVQRAAGALLDQEPTTHFYVQLPTWDMPRVVMTTDTQARLMRPDGTLGASEHHPWTQFVLDLHYYLTVPGTAGLTLVGMLGVLLFALTLSGLLSHPRMFRDAFRFRFAGHERLTQADIHNRLGVWTSPFVISSALTGAVLGLMAVISGAVASLDHDGDVEAVYAPVFGDEPAENPAPARLADIAGALRFMASEHPETEPTYVLMHEPRTEGQHLQILAEHPNRLIFGDYYTFGADGAPLGQVGMANGEAGQQAAASVYRLHFGSFGGMPIKLLYAIFGSALILMLSAGMRVYFARRRQRGAASPRLEGAWAGLVWGGPIALGLCYAASLLAPSLSLTTVFWLVLAGAAGGFSAVGSRSARRTLGRLATGVILLAAAGLHAVHHGLQSGGDPMRLVTALIMLAGLALLATSVPTIALRTRPHPAPAE